MRGPEPSTGGSFATVMDRIARHAELSTRCGSMSETELLAVIADGEPRLGWGVSRTVEVAGHAVFVKTLPVTAVELETYQSTANLFDLPATYQYGVGSAGFGAGRELAAHARTTQWVLDGHIDNFPLLYHHRLVPLAGQTRHRDAAQLESSLSLRLGQRDGDVAQRGRVLTLTVS